MIDPNRGTGRTTAQMLTAPVKAIFVVRSQAHLAYNKELARRIGREDLQIVPQQWITSEKWYGLRLSGIVLDHDLQLSERENHLLPRLRHLVRDLPAASGATDA